MSKRTGQVLSVLFCSLAGGPLLLAQGAAPGQISGQMPGSMQVNHAAVLVQPAATGSPAAGARLRASSLLDQSAAPASITFTGGRLTIQATNSSLRAILTDLQIRTGVKVEGLNHDVRIFGVYGPGNAQEVLSALLDDSGYNVLISGVKADGSPREIDLSARTVAAAAQPGAARTQAADEDDEVEADVQPPPPPQTLSAPAQPGQPNTPPQVKTPQQMLEEMQKLHQALSAGQGQSPAQQPPQ